METTARMTSGDIIRCKTDERVSELDDHKLFNKPVAVQLERTFRGLCNVINR